MIPNSPLGNTNRFPLYERGIEGDFSISATSKSPLTPLSIKGGTAVVPQYLTGFLE
jgi:hypothetical protein